MECQDKRPKATKGVEGWIRGGERERKRDIGVCVVVRENWRRLYGEKKLMERGRRNGKGEYIRT
jgi:hypothetical protein